MRVLSSRAEGTKEINCASSSLWWTMFGYHLSSIPRLSSSEALQEFTSTSGFMFFFPWELQLNTNRAMFTVDWPGLAPLPTFPFVLPLLLALALYKPNIHMGLTQYAKAASPHKDYDPWWINFLLHAQVNTVLSSPMILDIKPLILPYFISPQCSLNKFWVFWSQEGLSSGDLTVRPDLPPAIRKDMVDCKLLSPWFSGQFRD